jgi:hypothetical protein
LGAKDPVAHAAEFGFVQDYAELPIRVTTLARIVDEGRQLRARFEEPAEPPAQLRVHVAQG